MKSTIFYDGEIYDIYGEKGNLEDLPYLLSVRPSLACQWFCDLKIRDGKLFLNGLALVSQTGRYPTLSGIHAARQENGYYKYDGLNICIDYYGGNIAAGRQISGAETENKILVYEFEFKKGGLVGAKDVSDIPEKLAREEAEKRRRYEKEVMRRKMCEFDEIIAATERKLFVSRKKKDDMIAHLKAEKQNYTFVWTAADEAAAGVYDYSASLKRSAWWILSGS